MRTHARDWRYPDRDWPRCGGGGANNVVAVTDRLDLVDCKLCLGAIARRTPEDVAIGERLGWLEPGVLGRLETFLDELDADDSAFYPDDADFATDVRALIAAYRHGRP